MQHVQITVRCDGCGPQALSAGDLRLIDHPTASWYVFICPVCGALQSGRADTRVGAILRGAGSEPLPPITEAEIIAFRAGLDGMGWAAELGGKP